LSTTQLNNPHPPPHSHTLSVYTVHLVPEGGGGGGGGLGQREGRGATVHKYSSSIQGGNSSEAGLKIPTMSECIMYLQSIKSVKHNAPKFVNRSILKKSRHKGFGVFIVHSSMHSTVHTSAVQSLYNVLYTEYKKQAVKNSLHQVWLNQKLVLIINI
jgi:hypothetical protein